MISGLEVTDSSSSVGKNVDVVGLEREVVLVLGFVLVLVFGLVLLFPVVVVAVSGREGVPNNAGLGDGPEIPPGMDQTVPACGCVVVPVPVAAPTLVVMAPLPPFLSPVSVFIGAAATVIVVPISGPFTFPAVAVSAAVLLVLPLPLSLLLGFWFSFSSAFPSGQIPV